MVLTIFKRRLGWGRRSSESANQFGFVVILVGIFFVTDVSCKKYNSTSSTDNFGYSNVVSSFQAKNDSTAEASNSFSAVDIGRQARDYNPSSSYGAPAASSSGGYSNNVGSAGGWGATYAMPPIIMQHGGGGWGMTGGGWGSDDDDFGGDDLKDLKGLIGLLGLAGLKGLKPLKALKVAKGLGLLALSPVLLPLLPLLPILLLLPLLLPLLLLLFLPIPVISVPGGRRKRDLSGQVPTSKTLLQETIDDIMSQIPADFAQLRWKDVDQCMEKFMCDTGVMVSQVAPSMAKPAAWILGTLWPAPLQSKVETFRKVTEMMKHKKSSYYGYYPDVSSKNSFYYSYNQYPSKHSSGLCASNYKCRVKKLENLFHKLVVEQTDKLKDKLAARIPPGDISPATVFRALLT